MKKLEKFLSNKTVKKSLTMFMCLAMMLSLGISAFAVDTDSASEAVAQVQSAFTTVTGTVSITNILSMVSIALAACVGFFFFWWGIRKVIRMVTAAFKKGKISV